MAEESAEQQSFHTHRSQQKLLALVRAMIGGSRGREDDEHPLPPGPWDPIIRVALERIAFFGPQPEPWRVFDRSARRLFAGILARHPEIRTPSAAVTVSATRSYQSATIAARYAFCIGGTR
jgi:hypothetical protein